MHNTIINVRNEGQGRTFIQKSDGETKQLTKYTILMINPKKKEAQIPAHYKPITPDHK